MPIVETIHPADPAAAQPSTFNLQPSTFNLQPSTFNLQPSTFNLQPSTFNLQQSTLDRHRLAMASQVKNCRRERSCRLVGPIR
jgi:hypothetical protein